MELGNGNQHTENWNPETHFPWRVGTEPCGWWAFQAPHGPIEPLCGCRGPKGQKAGPSLPRLGKESHLPQTTPAQPRPLLGRGSLEACVFLFVCFKLEKLCLAGALGLFVTWQTGGRAENCCEQPGQLALHRTVDLSLPKAGLCLVRGSPSGITPTLVSGTKWHGEEVALWVPCPPYIPRTPPRSESFLLDPSITRSLLCPGPSLGPKLWETMGAFSPGTEGWAAGWGFLSSQSWAGFPGVMELGNP